MNFCTRKSQREASISALICRTRISTRSLRSSLRCICFGQKVRNLKKKKNQEKKLLVCIEPCLLFLSFHTFPSHAHTQQFPGPTIYTAHRFFKGFNGVVIAILFSTIFLGLAVAMILKHRDLIVKLFAQSIHSPIEVCGLFVCLFYLFCLFVFFICLFF